jgi:hypothetical protein
MTISRLPGLDPERAKSTEGNISPGHCVSSSIYNAKSQGEGGTNEYCFHRREDAAFRGSTKSSYERFCHL